MAKKNSTKDATMEYQGKIEPAEETNVSEEITPEENNVVQSSETKENVSEEENVFEEVMNEKSGLVPFFGRKADKERVGNQAVAWDRLFADYDFNIRDKETNYSELNLQILRDLLNQEGQKTPLLVSQMPDGKLKVLQGHRRYACMLLDRKNDLDRVADPSGKNRLAPENVRWQYVLVEVKKNLTFEDEVVEMLDHGGRKQLERAEIFDAIVRLRSCGAHWTETKILTKIGLPRSKATNHFKVATMPKELHEPYRMHLNGDESAPINMTADVIGKLYSAQDEDKKNKAYGVGGGPAFKKVWNEIKASPGKGTRGVSVKTRVEGFMEIAQNYHELLLDLGKNLLGEVEGVPKLDDVIAKIGKALNEVYPKEEVKVTEEGITREV